MAEEATGAEQKRLFARAAERYPQLDELARKTPVSSRWLSSHPAGRTEFGIERLKVAPLRSSAKDQERTPLVAASQSVFVGGGGRHEIDEPNAFHDPEPVIGLPAIA